MKKPTKEKKAALTALLDALTKAADKLAPTPTAAGIDIDPDFRHISVKLPPQSLVDDALAETNGGTREELNRRAERLEREYTNFIAARRKWRKEVADPIRAMRGEMGELADPAGKLRTLRRSICDDTLFLTGLLKGGRKSPQKNDRRHSRGYPHDEEAITILKEAARRYTDTRRYKNTNAKMSAVFADIIEADGIGRTQSDKQKTIDRLMLGKIKNGRRERSTRQQQTTVAEKWGRRLSAYMLDKGITRTPHKEK